MAVKPPSVDPLTLATRMREIVTSMAKGQVEALRPKSTYAVVVSVDAGNRTALVQFNGPDGVELVLPYGLSEPSAEGDVVRIVGEKGDRRIEEVVQGAAPKLRQLFGTVVAQIIGAGTAGAAGLPADAGHVHPLASAAPTALTIGNAAAEGDDATVARTDHVHAVTIPRDENSVSGVTISSSTTWFNGAALMLGVGTWDLVGKGQVEISVGAVNATYEVRLRNTTDSADLDNGDVRATGDGSIPFTLIATIVVSSGTKTVRVEARRTDTFGGSQTLDFTKLKALRVA